MLTRENLPVFDLQYFRLEVWKNLKSESLSPTPDSVHIRCLLDEVLKAEYFWAYPGPEVMTKLHCYLEASSLSLFKQLICNVVSMLEDNHYRTHYFLPYTSTLDLLDKPLLCEGLHVTHTSFSKKKPYFEVLVVHPFVAAYELLYRKGLYDLKTDRDEFLYDLVFVESPQAAIAAILANPSIQSVVCVSGFEYNPSELLPLSTDYLTFLEASDPALRFPYSDPFLGLSRSIRRLRPEIDQFFISEILPNHLDLNYQTHFNRILFHINPFPDLHFYILNGIRDRFSTPFFHAIQAYSKRPKGVFHALPISRGKSMQDSPWIQDFTDFYGPTVFLAETSSTRGGLDSLLDPKGAIKQSHDEAARTFGADHTYFVTNGTSTANKIVLQATLSPKDWVLVASDCHKSISYAVMLSGALPVFLETYSLDHFDLYGAVPLRRIKSILLELKAHGQLHKVKQVSLTNSTFDGILYNVDMFMMEILAIKPDIIFHWDEAWFAFGYFNPLYHGRSAMSAVHTLRARFQDPHYHQFYATWKEAFLEKEALNPGAWLEETLYPDPKEAKIRVYVTQSTHKTLTAFRQGSMIHISDDLFHSDSFWDAYRIHTSTSPNYQILASLDVGRRQVALEGFERVKHALYLAHKLRYQLQTLASLQPYFKLLSDTDIVPQAHTSTPSLLTSAYAKHFSQWNNHEFVVDPTRITLDVRGTGMDGTNFRELLINRYDIQVNKTSRYTVLFIVSIGSTQQSIDFLIQVLLDISQRLDSDPPLMSTLSKDVTVCLPKTRHFHPLFRTTQLKECEVAQLREPFYEAFESDSIMYAPLDSDTLKRVLNDEKLVSAAFVTPYPPGVPILVPGQIVSYEVILYLQSLKNKEIHGYRPSEGLKIFRADYLINKASASC